MSRTTSPVPFVNDLFDPVPDTEPYREALAPGAVILRNFARDRIAQLAEAIRGVLRQAPLKEMHTPGGLPMSVKTSSCGNTGWVSDEHGYRYARVRAHGSSEWPPIPAPLMQLALAAARAADYPDFVPDFCLINYYKPGAKLGLHQDKDERDPDAPIVSLSLGLPAEFLFGGNERSDKTRTVWLYSGDIVVWGGPSRMAFHGVKPVADGIDPVFGHCRVNLTFRKAL
jgi:alkylated DNA repair protein (DNA oxidative demethylase)